MITVLSQSKEKISWFCINVFLSKLVTFFDSTYFLVFSKEILENLILFQSVRILEIQKFPKFLEIANKSPILLVVRHFTGSERCFYQLLFLEFHKFISKISTWKCYFKKVGTTQIFSNCLHCFLFFGKRRSCYFKCPHVYLLIFVAFTQKIYLKINHIYRIEEIKIK